MRPPVVRLIAGRELRDLFRDRRSVVLLVILPVLLYPGFGLVGFYFALSMLDQPSVVGVTNADQLEQANGQAPPLLADGRFNKLFGDALANPELIELKPLPS